MQRGKAFSNLPSLNESGELTSPIDYLIETLMKIFESAPPGGVVIGSTDVILLLPSQSFEWHADGVTGLAIPCEKRLGCNHGVYTLTNKNEVHVCCGCDHGCSVIVLAKFFSSLS